MWRRGNGLSRSRWKRLCLDLEQGQAAVFVVILILAFLGLLSTIVFSIERHDGNSVLVTTEFVTFFRFRVFPSAIDEPTTAC